MTVDRNYRERDYVVPIFTSTEMFIIDEIHFPDKPSEYNIFGGGGSYSILGSRMVLPRCKSKKAAWVVDVGNDMPDEIFTELKLWDSGALFRYDNSRSCTRGSVTYSSNERQHFKFVSPEKRISLEDLKQYPHLLKSKAYHFIYSPERFDELTELFKSVRDDLPVIVWEPFPANCVPAKLDECLNMLPKVDIFSPNAAEAAALLGEEEPLTFKDCELLAKKYLKYMTKNNKSGVVLRCGRLGCFVIDNQNTVSNWLPAYHNPSNEDYNVVDPTGAGNSFVGAFCTGFILSDKNWTIGCICGNIAAGCAIEQHGMPKIKLEENKQGEIEDKWNDRSFKDRLKIYLDRNKELGISFDEFIDKLYIN